MHCDPKRLFCTMQQKWSEKNVAYNITDIFWCWLCTTKFYKIVCGTLACNIFLATLPTLLQGTTRDSFMHQSCIAYGIKNCIVAPRLYFYAITVKTNLLHVFSEARSIIKLYKKRKIFSIWFYYSLRKSFVQTNRTCYSLYFSLQKPFSSEKWTFYLWCICNEILFDPAKTEIIF